MSKANEMLTQIDQRPFGHFAVYGPPGSGKMTLVKLLASLASAPATSDTQQSLTYEAPSADQKSSQKFIVVTLEETFDAKNLVGTYVCSEEGDFVFKKGPLTIAAEQGLWLILRNIEDTPSDILSFLLPLIEQNTLQVSANFTIKPQLGFRIFALSKHCRDVDSKTPHFYSQQEEVIAPLMSLLTRVQLKALVQFESAEQLTARPDLTTILQLRFPNLFHRISD